MRIDAGGAFTVEPTLGVALSRKACASAMEGAPARSMVVIAGRIRYFMVILLIEFHPEAADGITAANRPGTREIARRCPRHVDRWRWRGSSPRCPFAKCWPDR